MSGATLVDVERLRSRGSAEPNEEPGLVSEDVAETEAVLRDQERSLCNKSGPRIRLRVGHPRITLRLKLQDTCPRREEKKKGEKAQKINK